MNMHMNMNVNGVMDEVHRRKTRPWFFAWLGRLDGWLLLVMAMLMVASLIILRSAAGGEDIILRQSLRIVGAMLVFMTLMILPPVWLRRMTPALYVITLILLILVPLVGVSAGGAQRWLNLGVVRLQPSELAKISVPMMVVWFLTIRHAQPPLSEVLVAAVIILVPVVLIREQPDLGTALLVGASGAIALFLAGLSWRLLIVGAILLAIAAPLFWFFGIQDYQRERVLTLFNPEADKFGAGWHIIQSQIAIGSGGISGKGYLQGTQSQLEFLPESSTDFIFAVIAEELGFVGVVAVIVLFGLMVQRAFVIGRQAVALDRLYPSLVAQGIGIWIGVQGFINMGVNMGLLPTKGLTLPLMSFGGSGILANCVALGILLRVDWENRQLMRGAKL